MLEEAVEYVKFLQLQIKVGPRKILARIILLVRAKTLPIVYATGIQILFVTYVQLLSSDDMWMFAPIAYNGVNVGLDLKISPPQQ